MFDLWVILYYVNKREIFVYHLSKNLKKRQLSLLRWPWYFTGKDRGRDENKAILSWITDFFLTLS